jgi:large subunit ribosomal protein L13e
MVKHNNQLVNNHFRKAWDRRVRTWFNQPGRKQRRRAHRVEKAAAIFPRPSGLLRPVVHCPTQKYNAKQRIGRGFTHEELKAAGLTKLTARGLGVSVDHRRRNQNKVCNRERTIITFSSFLS